MLLGSAVLLVSVLGPAVAMDNSFAGAWKVNLPKSTGRVRECIGEGTLVFPPKIFVPGSSAPDREVALPKRKSQNCLGPLVYKFTPSPDGRTLMLTRPNDPAFKAVLDKQ